MDIVRSRASVTTYYLQFLPSAGFVLVLLLAGGGAPPPPPPLRRRNGGWR